MKPTCTLATRIFVLLPVLLLAYVSTTAQQQASEPRLRDVPQDWHQHPEYGITRLSNPELECSYELIHLRDQYRRVFQNMDGTLTTVSTGQTMHYIDSRGWWHTPDKSKLPEGDRNFEVTTIEDLTPVPTCYFPNYQQSDITINFEPDHVVLNAFISWEFVAVQGTQAWMADQRTYIAGPSGQTSVFQGSGNTFGTQTYQTNTNIATGATGGSVSLSFYASRVWGGSGCNTTFNFIQKRIVEIVHDTLSFYEGPVVINEYSCSNRDMPDAFGNYEDWIELYNPNAESYDLTGYYLSDNPNNPTKWQFPGGIIPPGSHLLVICSGRDGMVGNTPHTNFRLSQLKPEMIIFSDPNGDVLESHPLFVTQNGHSFGRMSSGSEIWGVFEVSTPGYFNYGGSQGYTATPQLSHQAGFYDNSISLMMSTVEPNAEIRYTTNGAEPTASSTLYTGPITIDETTVIRARTYSSDGNILPGFMETNTYFIGTGHTIPVFSFSGDDLFTLFGGSQIEPIGAFEFFDENGVFIDESVGDFNKHGNDSWSYAQRGVDFIARDEYGYNAELEHKFFSTSNRTRFQRLMVKAAANDNFPFQSGGAHIRDSYIQHLSQVSQLNLDERSSTNVILYVNGQYWGVYDLREKVDDKDYTDYYYQQDRKYKGSDEYIQFLKTWGSTQPKYGNQPAVNDWVALRNYINNNDMGNPGHFAYVDSLLDISSLIDYFVMNSFVVSRDWLNYNTGWWRGLHPDGEARKWRYILWDMEAALGHFTNYTGIPDVTANAAPCNVENLNVGNGHAQSLKKLIQQNDWVRQRYITRYIDLLNTYFSCEHLIAVLDSMIAVIEPEMPGHAARWGGNLQTWQNNVQNVRNFLNQRCASLVNGLKNCYQLSGPYEVSFNVYPENTGKIKMNSVWLPHYSFEAMMYGGINTELTAQGFGPYQLTHWVLTSDSTSFEVESGQLTYEFTQNYEVTAHFENPNLDGKELLYYWHFNTLFTPEEDVTWVEADYKLIENSEPKMVYQGIGSRDIDAYQEGSGLNLQLIEEAGRGARVRNPALYRPLVFNMPTNGYGSLVFEYAVQRSPQGMLQHEISYSTDGVNFIQDALDQTLFDIDDEYTLVKVDLSSITAVNNNPHFHMRIDFAGNIAQTNGNNRFDNITLKGEEWEATTVYNLDQGIVAEVYPNPFAHELMISAHSSMDNIAIYDAAGKKVYHAAIPGQLHAVVNLRHLPAGSYLIHITGNNQTHREVIVRK